MTDEESAPRTVANVTGQMMMLLIETLQEGMNLYAEYRALRGDDEPVEVEYRLRRYKVDEPSTKPDGEGWEADEVRFSPHSETLNIIWVREKPRESKRGIDTPKGSVIN